MQYDQNKIAHQLEQDQVDLAIELENNLPDNFPSLLLMNEDLVLCFRKGHPLQDKQQISMEEYCALEHILVNTNGMNLAGYTDVVLQSLGYKRFVRHSISHFLLAAECLENTDLVCTLPRSFIEGKNYNLQYIELPFQSIRYKLRMIWHPKNQRNPSVTWLRDEIYHLLKTDHLDNAIHNVH